MNPISQLYSIWTNSGFFQDWIDRSNNFDAFEGWVDNLDDYKVLVPGVHDFETFLRNSQSLFVPEAEIELLYMNDFNRYDPLTLIDESNNTCSVYLQHAYKYSWANFIHDMDHHDLSFYINETDVLAKRRAIYFYLKRTLAINHIRYFGVIKVMRELPEDGKFFPIGYDYTWLDD